MSKLPSYSRQSSHPSSLSSILEISEMSKNLKNLKLESKSKKMKMQQSILNNSTKSIKSTKLKSLSIESKQKLKEIESTLNPISFKIQPQLDESFIQKRCELLFLNVIMKHVVQSKKEITRETDGV